MTENLDPKMFGVCIAEYLRARRHQVGETLDSASFLAGISKGTIWLWESNRRMPGIEALIKLCNSYGYTYEDFFGGLGKALDEVQKSK